MKKLLLLIGLIAILIIASINSNAQVFITLNPMQGHFNPGLLGNVKLDSEVGVYGNFLYGDFNYGGHKGIQTKCGAGFSYTASCWEKVTVLFGFSSSTFKDLERTNNFAEDWNYLNNTINLGFIVEVPTKRNLKLLALTDVSNWESQIGISMNIRKNDYEKNKK